MPMSPRLLRPRVSGDPDALRYIAAVQLADGEPLESGVRAAITDFVVGCKRDGIWSSIKASCILMGARTLAGALTPLVGSAPTNVNNNLVSGDYDRKLGLLGNGSTKWINTNRNNNAEPETSQHVAVYVTTAHTSGGGGTPNNFPHYIGCGDGSLGDLGIGRSANNSTAWFIRSRSSNAITVATGSDATGFIGKNRDNGSNIVYRSGGTTSAEQTLASLTPNSANIGIFNAQLANGTANFPTYSNGRIAFYSIGASLTLATLDTRVSALYTAIGAAI